MKKFSGIVLCSDVDGTLIDKNNKIPEANKEAIKYFQENGGKFMIATGRIPEAVVPILDGVTLDFPCICHNGCSLYDFEKKCYIDTIELSKEAAPTIDEVLEKSPVSGVEIMTTEGIYVLKQNSATDRHISFEKITARYVDRIEEIKPMWLKILFGQEEKETDALYQAMENSKFKKDYLLVRTHHYYYEIFNKSAGKGNMLKKMCTEYGIKREQLAVIGDNENDISMLEIAGISAAAGNGAKRVKDMADFVVEDAEDGAVADFILKLEKGCSH